MLQYSFCFPDNRFDTYEIRMRIDLSIQEHSIVDLIDFTLESLSIQKI